LFKGLDRAKVEKINELIDALNEKDKLLEKQEDLLYEEQPTIVDITRINSHSPSCVNLSSLCRRQTISL
jgi:hypothetical protein